MNRTTACENPFMGNGGAFGCGQCLPCRLKKRREWTHRIMLEASLQMENSFVTLTYRDDPVSLVPTDLQLFLKRLRKRVEPLKVRFYGVGEYGDRHQRPHFHLALFGYPSCGRSSRGRGRYQCCPACDTLSNVWGNGFVQNLPLEVGSARYIARYVVKKMTRFDDPRLGNRHPEFARMSLKPGIGAGVVEAVCATITRYNLLTPQGDVPVTLRHGDLEWPLGRYLRRQIRRRLGLDERTPHVLSAEASAEHFFSEDNAPMLTLLKASIADKENPSFRAKVLSASLSQRVQLKRRNELFNGKGKL